MPKGRIFLFFVLALILLAVTTPPLKAQEEENPGGIPIESEWPGSMTTLYSRGDQTFVISMGVIFPAFFSGPTFDTRWFFDSNIKAGGTGSLSYNYFLTPHIFVGGELGGMFAGTVGENMYYAVPFGPRVGYQFILGRFEFPLAVMVGGAPQKELDNDFFGLVIKPSASVFWRFNTGWSFGLNTSWWWLPQWARVSTVYGSFWDITLAARYHF